MLGAVAEYERSMIALRMRAGRRRKAERGGFAYGSPPLGWRAENSQLIPADDARPALDRIRELQAEGASVRSIAETLEREGFPTKRGARWHPTTVARVLRRLD